MREVRVWIKLRNEHIVPFVGLCISSSLGLNYPGLASPWMEFDLQAYIKAHPETSVKRRLSFVSKSNLTNPHNMTEKSIVLKRHF